MAELSGTVVVTGGGGYIGSALIEQLKQHPCQIIRIGRRELSPVEGVVDWVLDLTEKQTWLHIVQEADVIFHLAGNTSIAVAEADPEENLVTTLHPVMHLVAAARELDKAPHVVFASTVTVYGLAKDLPVVESIIPEPLTTYDLHKLYAEQQLEKAQREGLLSVVSLRLANVYGAGVLDSQASDRGILNKITQRCLAGLSIQLYGGGDYIRDYVYIDDVASAFVLAGMVQNSVPVSCNIASGTGATIKEVFGLVASEAQQLTGQTAELEKVPWPLGISQIERRNFIGSIDSFHSISGWSPKVSLDEGIRKLVQYHNMIGVIDGKS